MFTCWALKIRLLFPSRLYLGHEFLCVYRNIRVAIRLDPPKLQLHPHSLEVVRTL